MAKAIAMLGLAATTLAATTFVQGDPARFTYKQMTTPFSGPCDVSEGTDGHIYVQELLANQIARYNQNTGELKEFPIPFTNPIFPNQTIPLPSQAKAVLLTCAIRNGYDGKMYFSNGLRNQLVQFDAKTEKIQVFTPPGLLRTLGNAQPLNDLTSAPDGIYFTQTSMNTIAKFDYKSKQFKYFDIPTLLSLPLGIYHAKDGGIWFLEFGMNKVGRLDRGTGKIAEWSVPLPNGASPVVMRAETQASNGDWLLWFAAFTGSSLCSINQRTKQILCYPENVASNAQQVAQDHQNNVWISHTLQNTLGVFNPTTKNFTEIIMPGTIAATPVSAPAYGGTGIYCKPVGNPFTRGTGNAIWFTQLTTNRLVRYDLNGLKY
ncbi:Virginiamycin B lyase [Pseudocercospora fuligena]|uniref:Virginiamycin B lyase n=1 Tax=Pseudocercospora fuligena TaxID=685502 RepID=A0A8H6R804_9PEZI|nr:Virginiamycin B lyase [Pseudocercospora fuligena]